MNKFFSRWFVALVALLSAASALADPPSRVGRLAVHGGEVMVAHAGGEWRSVASNYPITGGDNVYVGPTGRAEIDFGSGLAWLSGGTTLYFEQLDDSHFRARMSDGQLVVRLRELDRGETARIDTRNGSIDLTTPGLFRVETGANNNSRGDLIHVKYGNAELSTGAAYEPLRGGDAAEFSGNRIGYLNIRGDDAFGAWADSRDRRYEGQRYAYVSPNMVGWRDLDEYGSWRESGSYGWVWYPRRVANDWAPYRFGHWTFVSPWGWTWVDDAPWGFAPFHYGRWVNTNGRWGWTPGPWERRPVYSPALVAWQGNVGGASFSVNIGSSALVYWTPLSWGEAYYPSYTVSANHWRLLNRPHVHNSVGYSYAAPRGTVYRNWNVLNGATAVEAAVVANARAVAPMARAMGPLPTTSQVEAYPVMDRIKPAYGGAPSQYGAPARQQAPTMVNEAAVPRAIPVNPGAQIVTQPAPAVPNVRPQQQPLPPVVPTQPAVVREQGITTQMAPPVQQPMQQPMPPQNNVRAPGAMSAPSRVMAPNAGLQTQPAQPAQPQQALPPLTQQDTRRVAPAQGRGEAPAPRVEQPYVEPIPRAPRAMPAAPVRVQPQQGDESRRATEEQPDKPKR